jgi:hypothetical protein
MYDLAKNIIDLVKKELCCKRDIAGLVNNSSRDAERIWQDRRFLSQLYTKHIEIFLIVLDFLFSK